MVRKLNESPAASSGAQTEVPRSSKIGRIVAVFGILLLEALSACKVQSNSPRIIQTSSGGGSRRGPDVEINVNCRANNGSSGTTTRQFGDARLTLSTDGAKCSISGSPSASGRPSTFFDVSCQRSPGVTPTISQSVNGVTLDIDGSDVSCSSSSRSGGSSSSSSITY